MGTSSYQPLTFPANRISRVGHFLLIGMMLPMLLPVAIYGLIFGTYRQAKRHAAIARAQQAEHAKSAVAE